MIRIPVFLASDNQYAPFVATTMASILLHTNEYIEFYILDCGISEKNKIKISNINSSFKHYSVEFLKINLKEYFDKFPELKNISKAMYARYLIPLLKPNLKKVIYSDIDVTFVGDIKNLYMESLDDKIIGAVPSQRGKLNNNYEEIKNKLNLSDSHHFFMSGLLLIDCELWNNFNLTNRLLTETKAHLNSLDLPDQEVFNIVFDNNYKELNNKYCVIYKLFSDIYTDEEIKKIEREKIIIHYPGSGLFKPWNNKELIGAQYFWDIVKYTNFRKDINKIYKNYNNKDNNMFKMLLKNIFSIRNNANKTHKIVTILGVKFQFKRSDTQDLNKIITEQNNQISELNKETKALRTLLNNCIDITKAPKARGLLRELQLADTILLEIFDKICQQHNLQYWLDYGTLLGAIRHNGFIPWDDDIDIAMLRYDYEKIRTSLKDVFENLGFTINEGQGYGRQILRIKYKDSPVQIDIWPHEFYFKDIETTEEERILSDKIKQCMENFYIVQPLEDLQQGKIKFSSEKLLKLTSEIVLENKDKDIHGTIFSGCEYIVYDKPKIIPNKILFPLKKVSFENIQLCVPNDSAQYLNKIYKDYLALPDFKDAEMCSHLDIVSNLVDIKTVSKELIEILEVV